VCGSIGEAERRGPGDMTALRIERGGVWIDITWKQYYADTQRAARALMHLGLKPHQSVSIIGFNAPQWFVANMGAIAAGGNAAGIYTTSEPDACAYVVEHSESRVVVVENNAQLAKFLKVKDRLVNVSAIVVYNEDIAAGVDGGRIKLLNWNDFMALGDNVPVAQLVCFVLWRSW
jgi:long-chain-fatty-acid--CoA ligase ACSBG